jgi:aspartyl/asparaginyl beta-hydroxylase (cupin superfamily)
LELCTVLAADQCFHFMEQVPPGCCEITVGGEARAWADGELLIFDDSFEHSVAHTGTGERLILIADVLHPQLEGTPGAHYARQGRR